MKKEEKSKGALSAAYCNGQRTGAQFSLKPFKDLCRMHLRITPPDNRDIDQSSTPFHSH